MQPTVPAHSNTISWLYQPSFYRLYEKYDGNKCREILPQILNPVLLLHGSNDIMVPDEQPNYLLANLKNSQYVNKSLKIPIEVTVTCGYNILVCKVPFLWHYSTFPVQNTWFITYFFVTYCGNRWRYVANQVGWVISKSGHFRKPRTITFYCWLRRLPYFFSFHFVSF